MAQKRIKDIASEEPVGEKQVLKEAEEREKERKEEEEQERQLRKETAKELKAEEKKEKQEKKVQIRRKPHHGKKYRQIAEQIEKGKEYPVQEAIDLALKTSPVKFDATVEVHIKMNAKEKNVRGITSLPGGVAKEKRVLGVTDKNIDEVVANVRTGKINFDILVADLKIIPKLTALAKVLGPKGLMPSPKAGTAVEDVDKAVAELKGGKVEYRADKTSIIHLAIGRVSFGAERVRQNYDALLSHLPKRIDSIFLATSMGPSIKVSKK